MHTKEQRAQGGSSRKGSPVSVKKIKTACRGLFYMPEKTLKTARSN
jgi:hypothetical protein